MSESESYARRVLERAVLHVPAVARLHRHRDELLAENAAQAAALASLTSTRERFAAERDALHAEIRDAHSTIAALEAERGRLSAELAAARARGVSLAAERDRVGADLARASSRLVHDEPVPDGPPRSSLEAIAAASAVAAAAAAENGPLVSIVCVCRNAETFIGRALASMRAQSYGNLELLVQDGGSTDRTLEIVRKTEGVRLESERDAATLDGLLRAARRASGEIVAVCWADDEVLPHAAGWAAAMFEREPGDVVYGDQLFVHDDCGSEWIATGRAWDRDAFLRQEFFPPFSSSFFRRSALVALAERLTVFDHDEFEFWLEIDRIGAIRHAPGLVSKFHVHGGSRWTKPGYCETVARGRRRAIAQYAAAAGEAAAPIAAPAELGLELWAALHEISCTGSIEHSLKHLERIQDRYDGDSRFVVTLARLLNAAKRDDMRYAERILRVAHRLGFDVGVLARRRAG